MTRPRKRPRPKLLDLFCGAGGAAYGYHQAGFEVVGVDHKLQPRYPFQFILGDALEFNPEEFVAVHASPPCPAYSRLARTRPDYEWPDLVAATREKLQASDLPYIIENVEGAPLRQPVLLCGSMFGLRVRRGDLKRHRLFECNFPVRRLHCQHHKGVLARSTKARYLKPTVGVYGAGASRSAHRTC